MLTFTGYFTTDGFKLIQTPGSWDNQWGTSDGALTGVKTLEIQRTSSCRPTAITP